MYDGLATASIIEDLLNSARFTDRGVGIRIIVNDSNGNLATVRWNEQLGQWKWEEGADPNELEEWAQEATYKETLR